jgi:hypothetical protein
MIFSPGRTGRHKAVPFKNGMGGLSGYSERYGGERHRIVFHHFIA